MKMVDFHSHVLPGVDDGAANLEVTEALLRSQKNQGVDIVVATPHLYKEASVSDFLMVRDNALSLVKESFGQEMPELVVGAEVELYCGLAANEDLKKLCIGNTNYMLIEMPFSYWNDWYYEELDALISKGIRPIIAHLDRYLSTIDDLYNIEKLFLRDVVIQINAESMKFFSFRRIFKELIKKSNVSFILGSDCHDLKKRPCYMEKAVKIIRRKYGENFLADMMYVAEMILDNQIAE